MIICESLEHMNTLFNHYIVDLKLLVELYGYCSCTWWKSLDPQNYFGK